MTTYQYQGDRQFLPGIPARDLAERDVARLSDERLELLEASGLYTKVDAEQLDPLGELSNAEYEQLTPAEKGARTRKANELKREDGDDDEPPTDETDGDAGDEQEPEE